MSNELKSFKKYSWLITIIFAAITFIAGLTIEDISFIPVEYQAKVMGIIGACALIIKLLPENYRVKIAELLIYQEVSDDPTPEEVDESEEVDEDDI